MSATRSRRASWCACALTCLANCATAAPAPAPGIEAAVMLVHDNGQATADVAFPDLRHEVLVRFDLPAGVRRARRLWLGMKAGGGVQVVLYGSTPLDGPGQALFETSGEIPASAASSGADGRLVNLSLAGADPLPATVFVGLRKTSGTPLLWAASVDSGHYFVRKASVPGDHTGFGLMNVRKTPFVRLELAP